MEDSANDNGSSENVFQDQSEETCRKATVSNKENLPSTGELASENQCLPSPRSAKVLRELSSRSPTPSQQAENTDQFVETPSRELQSHPNCSCNEGASISAQQQPSAFSMSVPEDSDASEAKTNLKDASPFVTRRNADFASPPERDTTTVNRWLTKNLKETNTPSPEKRGVETEAESTPVKRLKKTPDKPGTEIESHKSKLRFTAVSKASYKSPPYLQNQQIKVEVQNNEKAKSPTSTYTPRKRKMTRNGSAELKTANDPTLSYSISPSSVAESVDKSPTALQIHGSNTAVQNDNTSPSEGKKLTSSQDLVQTSFSLTSLKEEHESLSNKSTNASSEITNLTTRKQDGTKSTSDVTDEGVIPFNFTSEKVDTNTHPKTFTNSFFGPNVAEKQIDILPVSDLPPEILQPDLSVKKTESAENLKLNHKTSANCGLASESQNSNTEGFESCIKLKKILTSAAVSAAEAQSASNVVDSAVDSQTLKSSHSSPVISNSDLHSSCDLPQRSNSSVTNNPRPVLEFNTSHKRGDQNRSDSSIQTSTSDKDSRSQSKELSALESRGIHRRSLSDVTVTTRNSSEVQSERNPSNSAVSSHLKQKQASTSLPELSKSDNQTIKVVQPLFQEMLTRSASNMATATGNPHEYPHSGHSNQMTKSFPSSERSASRNNTEMQIQRNGNASLLDSKHKRFSSVEISTSRNQPEGFSDTSPPYINVFEGQASTSSYQPVVTVGSSFDQAPTSGNEREVTDIKVFQRHASTPWYQPMATGDFFYDQCFFPTPRNRCRMGELSTVRHQPSTPDSSSSNNSSDFQPENHPEYVVQARQLLLSVLKEIMLYDREVYLWNIFEQLFLLTSEPCSQLDSLNLISDLTRYLTKKAYEWCERPLSPCEVTEMHTQATYGKLTVVVIKALICTLSVRSSRDYLELVTNHILFRRVYACFSNSWNFLNIEDMQDEVSRNRVKTLKGMIERLLLVVLMAFQLLLMYVGENVTEAVATEYEDILPDEDKTYLKRNFTRRF